MHRGGEFDDELGPQRLGGAPRCRPVAEREALVVEVEAVEPAADCERYQRVDVGGARGWVREDRLHLQFACCVGEGGDERDACRTGRGSHLAVLVQRYPSADRGGTEHRVREGRNRTGERAHRPDGRRPRVRVPVGRPTGQDPHRHETTGRRGGHGRRHEHAGEHHEGQQGRNNAPKRAPIQHAKRSDECSAWGSVDHVEEF